MLIEDLRIVGYGQDPVGPWPGFANVKCEFPERVRSETVLPLPAPEAIDVCDRFVLALAENLFVTYRVEQVQKRRFGACSIQRLLGVKKRTRCCRQRGEGRCLAEGTCNTGSPASWPSGISGRNISTPRDPYISWRDTRDPPLLLAYYLRQYCQNPLGLHNRHLPEMPFAFVAADPCGVRDAPSYGRAAVARVPRAALIAFIKRWTQYCFAMDPFMIVITWQ